MKSTPSNVLLAQALRLIVVPKLTHYGHVESPNERLANLMVTGFRDYFLP